MIVNSQQFHFSLEMLQGGQHTLGIAVQFKSNITTSPKKCRTPVGSGGCHWPLTVRGRSWDTVTIAHSFITRVFADGLKQIVAVHVVSMRAYFKNGCISFLLLVWIQQNHSDDSNALEFFLPRSKIISL